MPIVNINTLGEMAIVECAVHLYWMWRKGLNYDEWVKLGSHAGEPGNRHGVQ